MNGEFAFLYVLSSSNTLASFTICIAIISSFIIGVSMLLNILDNKDSSEFIIKYKVVYIAIFIAISIVFRSIIPTESRLKYIVENSAAIGSYSCEN